MPLYSEGAQIGVRSAYLSTIYFYFGRYTNIEEIKEISKMMEKNVLEENGHRWWNKEEPNDRCVRCSIKYGYYLVIKRALEEHPERDDLRELIKCKK